MRIFDRGETTAALPWEPLIDAIGGIFRRGLDAPVRHHHAVPVPGEEDATLLLMPAWQAGRYIGVKIVTVTPGNAARSLPAIHGSYLLMDGQTGDMLAMIDGGELTARRTAAASALAGRYLARKDASHLLMVGCGRLAPNLIAAHSAVRPITRVSLWGRNEAKAAKLTDSLTRPGLTVTAVSDLEAAAREADIISCATLSEEPLIRGDWLKPGSHLDLVGAFKPTMRESDDEVARRATIFVDTREGALAEAGDIVQPLEAGVITSDDIAADFADLTTGEHPGRIAEDEITLFKSVGSALEDLAGAILAYEGQL